jgi:hypothetical protein
MDDVDVMPSVVASVADVAACGALLRQKLVAGKKSLHNVNAPQPQLEIKSRLQVETGITFLLT